MADIQLNECVVCCEVFNTTTNVQVACEHVGVCEYEACSACIKTYLVGISTDPNCMQCNKAWSDKFLAKQLGATYMKGEYVTHRKELLVQQQLARLPETMAAAEQYKQVKVIQDQQEELTKQHKAACKEYDDVMGYIQQVNTEMHALKYDTVTEAHALIELREKCANKREKTYAKMNQCIATKRLIMANIRKLRHDIAIIQNGGEPVGAETKKEEARKFIMPCPNADCRGYLSSQYKCELCEHHTCAKCFDLIGLHKEDAGHVCKPENVESAEFIRKQSKPCPCCGTRISKIDGCDQMWCTQCKKAFSWNTGKIVTGTIHNPHFYQYQREHGGGVAPRNPGDVVCGGLPGFRQLNETLIGLYVHRSNPELFNTITNIHRLQGHFTEFQLRPLRTTLQAEENFELERVQYILQELNRKELANKVFRKDKSRKIKTALLHVCELFIAVGTDMFQKLLLSHKTCTEFLEELEVRIEEYEQLRQYCNEHFKEISILYGVCVPEIKENWTSSNTKYNDKGETDKYILKRDEQRLERKKERERKWEEYQATQAEARRIRLLQVEEATLQMEAALMI
jgi:hypothetical protein